MEEREKKAVALKREEDGTLKVIASGTGKDAEALIEKAREHNVEVIRDPDEIEKILKGQEKPAVPEKIYGIISEIVSFVTEVNDAWLTRGAVTGEEEVTEEEPL
jgi:flagellar biosynthesis protein